MKHDLDDVASSIRDAAPAPNVAVAAAERVRRSLGLETVSSHAAPGRIESCEGFRARIPDLVAGRLPSAEALLVEDHTRECVPCRRALLAARAGRDASAFEAPVRRTSPRLRLAIAASIAATALVGFYALREGSFFRPAPEPLTVVATDGDLYSVETGSSALLAAGNVLPEDRVLRTADGARATLRMADGSEIEMRDRTELTVERRSDGATIRLSGGGIIVHAAKQGSGHLDVRTGDAVAVVKGTIFSVSTGVSGSVVGVLEGAVQVRAGGEDRLLHPGDQAASRPGIVPGSLAQQVSWSRNADEYRALLDEVASLRRDLGREVVAPAPRRAARLLTRVPDDTVLYVAVPNLTDALDRAVTVFRDHLDRSQVLRDWWDSHHGSASAEKELEDGIAELRAIGREIGDEVVIAVPLGADGRPGEPVFLAEVRHADAVRDWVAARKIDAEGLEVRVGDDLVVAGPKRALAGFDPWSGAKRQPSRFERRIAAAYDDGAGFLFAADLGRILAAEKSDHRALEALGFANADHVIVEREEREGRVRTTATLTFAGEREGIASWISGPAPLSALRYVSPDATAAVAVAMRSPGRAVDELFSRLGAADPQFASALDSFRKETGLDPLDDLARPLGGEIVIALDGPVLPTPSWKIVAEVYDPARLQRSVEALVDHVNGVTERRGDKALLTLETETVGSRTFHGVVSADGNASMWFAFDGPYLVAGPSRAVVNDAIDRAASGVGLPSSKEFRALLPADSRTEFSAVAYQKLEGLLKPLGALAPSSLPATLLDGRAVLFTVVAEDDRLVASLESPGGLGSDLGSLLSALATRGPEGWIDAKGGPSAP